MADWIERFASIAKVTSTWSKDPSTKVGAVLFDPDSKGILPSGYNGFPRGYPDTEDALNDRNLKYPLTIHAELNCILTCARYGVRTLDMGIASTLYPCSSCAGAIANAGIKMVIAPCPDWAHPRWGESFKLSRTIFERCKIQVGYCS